MGRWFYVCDVVIMNFLTLFGERGESYGKDKVSLIEMAKVCSVYMSFVCFSLNYWTLDWTGRMFYYNF